MGAPPGGGPIKGGGQHKTPAAGGKPDGWGRVRFFSEGESWTPDLLWNAVPRLEGPHGGGGPVVAFLEQHIARHSIDLVVPIGGAGALFADRHRERLFPATPLLLMAAEPRLIPPSSLSDLKRHFWIRRFLISRISLILTGKLRASRW